MSDELYSLEALESCWERLRLDSRTGQVRELAVGVDGVRREYFERSLSQQLREIHRRIHQQSDDGLPRYDFGPLLQIERPRDNGLVRRLFVPRVRDQLLFRRMHDLLRAAADGRGLRLTAPAPAMMVGRLRRTLQEHPSCTHVLQTDISAFFDRVPRHRLEQDLDQLQLDPLSRGLFRRWMSEIRCRPAWATTRHRDILHDGLPQGVSVSSPLAELWVQPLDRALDDLEGVFLYRYIDDLLVLAPGESSLEEAFRRLLDAVEERGLSIAAEKTRFSKLSRGFSWLGLIHRVDSVMVEPSRHRRWRKRLAKLRTTAGQSIADAPDADSKLQAAHAFLVAMRREADPRHNFRIGWYAHVDQLEPWKDLDRLMHNMIASAFRQAGSRLPEGTRLPSIYRSIYHRRRKVLSPSSHCR